MLSFKNHQAQFLLKNISIEIVQNGLQSMFSVF